MNSGISRGQLKFKVILFLFTLATDLCQVALPQQKPEQLAQQSSDSWIAR